MSNIRFKFIRGEEVKYISHLDLMKVFERALRRSNIPIAYSQGFNPHPQMVFGLPLSVGVSSESEYADFELTEHLEPSEFITRLNKELPTGLKVIEAIIKETKTNIMATVALASYDILISVGEQNDVMLLQSKINEFMLKDVIIVKKEGKKGVKDVDIRPMIQSIEFKAMDDEGVIKCSSDVPCKCSNTFLVEYIKRLRNSRIQHSGNSIENIFCLTAQISAGSKSNLKPELLVLALNEVTGLEIKLVKIHRTGLFVSEEGKIEHPFNKAVLMRN